MGQEDDETGLGDGAAAEPPDALDAMLAEAEPEPGSVTFEGDLAAFNRTAGAIAAARARPTPPATP